jgi:hypothetical protein
VQAAGPSKFKRVAEFMVNTVVAGLTGALRKAQASLTAATRKAEAAAKEAQEVGNRCSSSVSCLRRGHALPHANEDLWSCNQHHGPLTEKDAVSEQL